MGADRGYGGARPDLGPESPFPNLAAGRGPANGDRGGRLSLAGAFGALFLAIGVYMPFFPGVPRRARAVAGGDRDRHRDSDAGEARGAAAGRMAVGPDRPAAGDPGGDRSRRRGRLRAGRLRAGHGRDSGRGRDLGAVLEPVVRADRRLRRAPAAGAGGRLRPRAALGLGELRRRQPACRAPRSIFCPAPRSCG